MRYHVYYHLVQVAKQTDQVKAVFRDVDHLKAQFAQCPPSNEQMQKLYRLLHDVLSKGNQSEQAAKVMIELLGTYTAENASYARDDAIRCIISALDDPNTFLLDPLLALKPVRFLGGELIHDLLSVFVSENLTSYMKFYKDHKEFVQSLGKSWSNNVFNVSLTLFLGLNHEKNMKKMRLLTFMQLAESHPEMSFDMVQTELQISAEEVEPFIIEVLKTKLVRARMDQSAKKIYTSSTMHRTFERAQWQQLKDLLHSWKTNLSTVQEGMKSITAAQMELINQH